MKTIEINRRYFMKVYKLYILATLQLLVFVSCATMTEAERKQYLISRISEKTHCSASDLTIGNRKESASLSRAYTWDVTCKGEPFICFDTRGSFFCTKTLKEDFKKPKIIPFRDNKNSSK